MPEVALSSGTSNFQDEGRGAPAIVLIHGMGLHLGLWDEHTRSLAGNFRVVRYDTLGHGATVTPPGPWNFHQFARQLMELLEYLKVERPIIVGFSLGGSIAQSFAIEYPKALSGLVIVAAACGRTLAEHRAVEARYQLVQANGPSAVADATMSRWFTLEFQLRHPQIVDHWKQQLLLNSKESYSKAYQLFLRTDEQLGDRIRTIGVPTLIITGDRDLGQTSKMARRMAARIKGSVTRILPNIAHMLPIEAGDELVCMISAFAQANAPPENSG